MDDANPNAAEVCALGIVDQHRGKGLGKALLGYAIATALGKRLHPVVLSVSAENEAALGLYKSEGFTTTKTMVCYTLDCA
jgi:ribosomal protein S18 acetylase RimI-like enzyme